MKIQFACTPSDRGVLFQVQLPEADKTFSWDMDEAQALRLISRIQLALDHRKAGKRPLRQL